MCKDWTGKLAPRCVRIIGGEPLLHPEIDQIVEIVAEYWGKEISKWSGIEVVTNGSLLDKMSPTFYALLKKHNILLKPTLHHPDFAERLNVMLERVESPTFIEDYTSKRPFGTFYQIEDSKPKLFESDSKAAFEACYLKRVCHELVDNKLHHCSVLAYMRKAYEYGIISDARVMEYVPATPDMSDEELREWYRSDFSRVCAVCPDNSKRQYVDVDEKLPDIKRLDTEISCLNHIISA